MRLYLAEDLIVVDNPFENALFAYNRKSREKYTLNEDIFVLLKYIGEHYGYEKKKLQQVFEMDNMDGFINSLINLGILVTNPASNSNYQIKQLKTINLAKLTFEITNGCNLLCKHCFGNFGMKRIDLEEVKIYEAIKQAADYGAYELVITGGEPFLYASIKNIIEYGYSMGFIITVFSNLELPIENVNCLNKIDRFITSIEANDYKVHDHFRGKNGAYKNTLRAIDFLRKRNIKIAVNFVIGMHNLDFIENTIKFLKSKELDVVIDILNPEGRALSLKTDYGVIITRLRTFLSTDNYTSATSCGVGIRMLYICATGDITPCASLREEKFSLGNINEEYAFDKIFVLMQKRLGNTVCKHIEKNKLCNGGCRARALYEFGSTCERDTLYCGITGGCKD